MQLCLQNYIKAQNYRKTMI